jgi:ClpP class serine protease
MPIKQSDLDIIISLQKEAHGHFIDHVKSRRKNKLTQPDDTLFNGEFWAGNIAKNFGLIDGIDDIYNFLQNKFGKEVHIEYIKTKESWFKKKFMSSLNSEDIVEALYSKFEQELISSQFKIY